MAKKEAKVSVVNVIILVDDIDIRYRPNIRNIVSNNKTIEGVKNGCTFILNIISVGNSSKVDITYNKDESTLTVNRSDFTANKFYILISHYRETDGVIRSARINNIEISDHNDFQDDYSCEWINPIPDAEVYFCSISGNLIEQIISNNNFQNLINKLTC